MAVTAGGVAGLEVWLVGTRADLAAAHRALSALGAVVHLGELHPADRPGTGRYRAYLRIAVATQPVARTARRLPPGGGPGALPLAG